MFISQIYNIASNQEWPSQILSRFNMGIFIKISFLSTTTDKRHMNRTRQGVRSTQSNWQAILNARDQVDNMTSLQRVYTAIDNTVFCFTILVNQNDGAVYTDLSGRFPVPSFCGMKYIVVAYIYKINTIIISGMPSRTYESLVNVFKDMYEHLKVQVLKPKLCVRQ